ncbi:SDR family NAD(P)-dependent oxidoreductase [Agromyces salentinus]|uniref:SDR family NAD(P)-dependent oxidoreductase n=1 Tax=Agromyces salentinus TaxID=269421 RepID=UPI001BA54A96|nr:SDR family oxidoreductase [Agromyces salentinus]
MDGRTALVTGSTSGIGAAIADGLEQAGAVVIRHGLSPAPGAPGTLLTEDLAATGAGDRLAVAALEVGTVDILVHSASVQIRRPWQAITAEQMELQLRVNLLAFLELAQRLVPPMSERGWGRVLAIGSVQQGRPHPEMAGYAASKAAQVNLVANLAKQVAPTGVTINSLSPGVIDTPRNRDALASDEYHRRVVAQIPAGRIGSPGDCVPLALLLCSDAGAYITGRDLPVDGGYLL